MRKVGLSVASVLALAVPAWAQSPLPAAFGGYPAPAGVPLSGYEPGMYSGGFMPPDTLPPFGMAPPSAPPGAAPGMPPAAPPNAFTFDPYNGCGPAPGACPAGGQLGAVCCRTFVPDESWVRADWLLWHLRNGPLPPLIVSGNPALPNPGVPGSGNFSPLVGPSTNVGMLNGARLTLGTWFDPDAELGGEVSGFMFARRATSDVFQGGPGMTLGVPVTSTTGTQGVYNYAVPGQSTGSLGVQTASQLYSGEATLIHRWYENGTVSVTGMVGYRYLQLDESVGLYGQSQAGGLGATFDGAALPAGVLLSTTDLFRANTQFHGGEIGARLEARSGLFTFTAFTKNALGANIETLRIDGQTQASGFGVTQSTVGGVRALPSNFGRAVNTEFSWMSELGTDLGVNVTKHVSFHVGYNMLYWTRVLRPGSAIDPVINPAQVPIDPTYNPSALGPRPLPAFHTSDVLAHGLVVGIVVGW
jgi:hypothetical protein